MYDQLPKERPHGLTHHQVVLAGAAPEVFYAFKQALMASLKPEGELEMIYAEAVVAAQWGLRRCQFAEASLCKNEATDPLLNPEAHAALRLIDMRVRRHERTIDGSLRELRRLQSEREFRRLASVPVQTAPLAGAAAARRAFVAEQSATSRANQVNLRNALEQFLNQPAPGGDVAFDVLK